MKEDLLDKMAEALANATMKMSEELLEKFKKEKESKLTKEQEEIIKVIFSIEILNKMIK